jgi:two-component system alkaline phosphatase synthesis response regulator PhoP
VKRILFVDDDRDVLECLEQLFSPYYAITVAYNGREAVEFATREPFDLIVLDLMMPVMDGKSAALELAARGVRTPILVASASSDVRATARSIGAADALLKPYDFIVMQKKIAALLDPSAEE